MSASEPPNPYAATTAPLADVLPAANATAPTEMRKPSRFLVFVVALLTNPFLGAGFYLLGHRRRSVAWTATGVLVFALMLGSCWAPVPKLVPIALVAVIVVFLASVVATAIAKPSSTPARHTGLSAVLLILIALAGNTVVRLWIVEAFQIPSGTMTPTLLVGDRMFIKKGRAHVTRGDVIVFEFPADRSTDYVKRVVAVGGDTVEVSDGIVSINGVALAQAPLPEECGFDPPCQLARETNGERSYPIMFTGHIAPDFPRFRVADGQVFVLGDNRDNSYDSRKWGTVPVDHVKGTATVTWWSRGPHGGVRWSRVGRGVD